MAGWRDAPVVGGGWQNAPVVSGATEQPQVGLGEDVARSGLGGAIRGVGGIMDLPAMIGRAPMQLSDRFLGTNFLEGTQAPMPFVEAVGEVAPGIEQAAAYEPQTVAGGYAQTTGEFLPGLVTPGGPLARLGYGVVAPAFMSETAGLAAEGLGAGETGQGIARLAGAIAGPAVAERTIRGLISPMAGATSAPRMRAAETLRQADVPVSAGQQAGAGGLRMIEGTGRPTPEQVEGLTAAALRSIGSSATSATDDVLRAERGRIGGVFGDFARTVTPDVQPFRVNQIQRVVDAYVDTTTANPARAIVSLPERLSRSTNPPTAKQLQEWRSSLSALTQSSDGPTRDAAIDALDALDDIIGDSLRSMGRYDDVARLDTARDQWRGLLAIERGVQQGGEEAAEGLLTPGALRMGVQRQNPGQYVRGERGEFGDLTRAAQTVLGTAPTTLPFGVRALAGGARVAAGGVGGYFGGIPGAVAGLVAPEAARSIVNSPLAQAYLRNQLVAPYAARLNPAQRALLYGPTTAFPSVFNQGQAQ